jgi:putative hydrolases of HD superfamily
MSDSLSFISDVCGALKKLKRTGWVKHSIPLPESDSDHMHRCAMCALLVSQPADPRDHYDTPETEVYHPSKVDTTRLLRMAVTHDLCEALAGDITPFCDPTLVNSKHEKEDQAMRAIQKVVGDPLGEELYGLWKEYEELKTVEAIYCKDIGEFIC